MTMQVGMVGTDGVLIASDTQWTDNDSWPRRSWNQTKFKISHECGVAISCAGGMVTAGHLADEIICLSLKDENWLSSDLRILSKICEKVLSLAGAEKKEAQCIVASTRPTPKLHSFRMVKMSGGLGLVGGEEQLTKVCAGDDKNAAIFWAERYYPQLPKASINKLVPLAAHLVVTANILNTAGISGLEIVLCDDSGKLHRLSDDILLDLELKARERDKSIGDSLLSG